MCLYGAEYQWTYVWKHFTSLFHLWTSCLHCLSLSRSRHLCVHTHALHHVACVHIPHGRKCFSVRFLGSVDAAIVPRAMHTLHHVQCVHHEPKCFSVRSKPVRDSYWVCTVCSSTYLYVFFYKSHIVWNFDDWTRMFDCFVLHELWSKARFNQKFKHGFRAVSISVRYSSCNY